MHTGRLVVGITGASGAVYALQFLKHAVPLFKEILVIMSDEALQVIGQEAGKGISRSTLTAEALLGEPTPGISFLNPKSYFTPPASGSYRHDGMVIIPCSMGTAGRIATGVSNDLMSRAADVCMKERRKLILVVRETPLNLIHLRNLTQLAEAGAVILPACPSFYSRPATIEAAADTVVARVLQHLGVEHNLQPEWQAGD